MKGCCVGVSIRTRRWSEKTMATKEEEKKRMWSRTMRMMRIRRWRGKLRRREGDTEEEKKDEKTAKRA